MWKIWIPIVLFLVPLILERQIVGTSFTPYVYGLIITIYGIVYYFRIRMWETVVLMISMAITISWYFLAERPGLTFDTFALVNIECSSTVEEWIITYLNSTSWFAALFINFILTYTLGPKLIKALALEKNAIKLFRLSARSVSDEQSGYTERPLNVGTHDNDKNELYGLTAFLESKRICIAEFPGNGVKYVFSMGTSPLVKNKRDKLSHVFFGNNGELNVFISAEDYRQYRRKYSFDQLCNMMGNTFLRFAEYHKSSHNERILSELKAV